MSERRDRTRADQTQAMLGTPNREYQITVTATLRNGKQTELRRFSWNRDTGWGVDLGRIYSRLEDPGNVDNVVSAVLSKRHARLTQDRTAYQLASGFDVPVDILWTIFDAHRSANRHAIDVDKLKGVVTKLDSDIRHFNTRKAAEYRRTQASLFGDHLSDDYRRARDELYAKIQRVLC